ncbi:hypothetical protein [Woeseia oceani]|uniref:hypothetical protein n=1 Tax=Woeseia oceani TaxID=1548547 RepID=UPI0012E9F43C|nr:hypothetical protein [Woeseia oceani]
MDDGVWIALGIVLLVVIYVLAKVLQHMRRSRELWEKVDKSKLREWEDEDDW